ncbi:MAG: ABC transporter ATP-binding protein [Deltaproteobacteria bacterium]|nr:ABC transporter ATP-binding protein [Deltaproteobacteria bacterium]
MIRISHLTKQFGPLTALKDLSLEVPKGEIFGFLGPNGAGKTTTLKIMAGVLAPTAGDVTLGGFSILTEPAQAKAITGYIPDRPFLYDKLTGLEFLHFVGGLYGLLPIDIDKEMESRINLFDLWDWRDELIESYSHGMKQRLIIIAALIHHPRVLIVDEPMVGLDPKGVRIVKRLFQKESAQGMTIFLSTHTLSTAQEICGRIGIIQKGALIALGSIDSFSREADWKAQGLESLFLKLTGDMEEEPLDPIL